MAAVSSLKGPLNYLIRPAGLGTDMGKVQGLIAVAVLLAALLAGCIAAPTISPDRPATGSGSAISSEALVMTLVSVSKEFGSPDPPSRMIVRLENEGNRDVTVSYQGFRLVDEGKVVHPINMPYCDTGTCFPASLTIGPDEAIEGIIQFGGDFSAGGWQSWSLQYNYGGHKLVHSFVYPESPTKDASGVTRKLGEWIRGPVIDVRITGHQTGTRTWDWIVEAQRHNDTGSFQLNVNFAKITSNEVSFQGLNHTESFKGTEQIPYRPYPGVAVKVSGIWWTRNEQTLEGIAHSVDLTGYVWNWELPSP
jgi:hypothetical protein